MWLIKDNHFILLLKHQNNFNFGTVEKRKRIIVSVTNDLSTDQRVKKICEFLHHSNFEIILCGRLLKNSIALNDRPYKIKRFKLWFNKGALFYANYNLRLFFFLLTHKTDWLLANDLDTLLANAWCKRIKRKLVLVYDAHEYFTEVPEIQNKPFVKKVWQRIEKKSLPRVNHFYTVNESISKLYKTKSKLDVKIVRNISDPKQIQLTYTKADLGLPEGKKIVIMQGAGINIDRGAEEAIEAIQLVAEAVLIFVGDGDVIPILKQTVRAQKLEDKVFFFPKQPYQRMMNYTMHSDLGLALDKATNINYQLALPNKLFDYIHAGIPTLSSDLIEIKKIIQTYKIGLIAKDHSITELANCMQKILFDDKYASILKNNCEIAALDLTWQNETKVLQSVYG
ncbi:MAG: glycosyltransferase [Crocinitomicaceae bacterium]